MTNTLIQSIYDKIRNQGFRFNKHFNTRVPHYTIPGWISFYPDLQRILEVTPTQCKTHKLTQTQTRDLKMIIAAQNSFNPLERTN